MSDGPAFPPPSAPPPTDSPAVEAARPWWKRWWVIALGAFVVLVAIGAAIGGGDDDTGDDDPVADPVETTGDTRPASGTSAPSETSQSISPPTTEETTTTTSTTTSTLPPTTTAPPAPVVIDGTGNQVVPIGQTLTTPQVLVASNDGSSNFIVYLLDDDLQEVGLAVNEIGPATSKTLELARDDDSASHVQVTAEGSWRLEFVEMVPAIESGLVVNWDGSAPVSGSGTDLVFYNGEPGILQYSNTGDSNFIVYALSGEGDDLLVNEIGPIEGSSRITRGPLLLRIDADGSWTFAVQPV